MFRHKENMAGKEEKIETPGVGANTQPNLSVPATETDKSEASLKELIEKNLKWSQIIYEQNRKINNKLLWSAIADWLRMLLIAVPLVLGLIFLPPLFKGVVSQYGDLLGNGSAAPGAQQSSLDNIFKLFTNLDPAKQEQLKALFK